MWSYDATKLSHGVGETYSNTGCDSAVERANTFWPNDWISRASAGCRYDETEVLHNWIGDGDEKYITKNGGGFDCF